MMAGAHDGMAAVKAAVESSTGDESQMRRPLHSIPGLSGGLFSASGEGRDGGRSLATGNGDE